MSSTVLIVLIICVSWVLFSLINMGITMALNKRGGSISLFFMFCPIINILCPFVCLIVYLDECQTRKTDN